MRMLLIILLCFQSGINLFAKDTIAQNGERFEIRSFAHLPVQHEGRLKPMDTVARQSLLLLHGSQSLRYQGKTFSPIEWLLHVLMNSEYSKLIKLIRIENPDLLGMIGKESATRGYYSILDLEPYFKDIYSQASEALMITDKQRDGFQQSVILLWQQIATYLSLSNTLWIAGNKNIEQELSVFDWDVINKNNKNRLEWFKQRYQYLTEAAHFNILYPRDSDPRWLSMGEGLLNRIHETSFHPGINAYVNMLSAFHQNDIASFNTNLNNYLSVIKSQSPKLSRKIILELLYNNLQLFFFSTIIYLLVFILSVLSWIIWPKWLKTISVSLLIIGFVIHSFGLGARMIIEGRPPVTNLYSSAIFVGWGTVFFSLILKKVFRNCMGCIVGAVVGSLSLIVAHHLIGSDDTMEVLRAVLDSNFWLSTHVVTITLGYSATFLAGSLASLFILRGTLTRSFDKETSQNLAKIVYGTICFSFLLSTIGTILGAIWAELSWGRFWGWDPKENGALLIILWNAMILHAKRGGVVKSQGLMVMAAFGNIVTSLSWFGVNMLGIGLHSYGFMNGAFLMLGLFTLIQLSILCLGCIPKHYWLSNSNIDG